MAFTSKWLAWQAYCDQYGLCEGCGQPADNATCLACYEQMERVEAERRGGA